MRTVLSRLWSVRRALAFYGALLLAGWLLGETLRDLAIPEMRPMNEPMIHRIVMGALLVYVLAAAIPFVPGAEIGFALLLLFGAQAAPLVYVGMVGALLLAFAAARFIPLAGLSSLLRWLGLRRWAAVLRDLAETPHEDRSRAVSAKLTGRVASVFLRNRYVLLALLLNAPGNSVLGGGGGLAFSAGVSGLYRFWPYLLCVLIAVAPVPLTVYMVGG